MTQPLYRLMAWLSPAYPVGAFSYSHGLETAVEEGRVTGLASLTAWIEAILRHGAGRSDGALFAAAGRAAAAGDDGALEEVCALAAARAAWPAAAMQRSFLPQRVVPPCRATPSPPKGERVGVRGRCFLVITAP